MTTVNPLVKRCYTMSEPHLSGHRVILGFNTMKEAQDAHDFIASIRPSPADAPCQSAGAAAPGECGSVPDERAKFDLWYGKDSHFFVSSLNVAAQDLRQARWEAWQARAELGMQPPNNQPNSDHVAVISAKPDSVHLAAPTETATDTSLESERERFQQWAHQFSIHGQQPDAWEAWQAALQSASQGRAIVPVEPTWKMVEAGRSRILHKEYVGNVDMMLAYRAMIEVAQSGISSLDRRPNEQNDVAQEGKQ